MPPTALVKSAAEAARIRSRDGSHVG